MVMGVLGLQFGCFMRLVRVFGLKKTNAPGKQNPCQQGSRELHSVVGMERHFWQQIG